MTDPTITDETVEALRTALAEWECGCLCDDRLRAGLAAVKPHLAETALRWAASNIEHEVGSGAEEWLTAAADAVAGGPSKSEPAANRKEG